MSKRPRTEEEEDLECPICTEHLLPPVYQCHEGHLLCSNCLNKTRNICPTCKDAMPPQKIRNRAIEKIIRDRLHPCSNYDVGCRERLTWDACLFSHQFDCFYSYHQFCFVLGMDLCSKGKGYTMMKDLKEHLEREHEIKWSGERNLGEEFQMVDKIPQGKGKSKPNWGAFSLSRTSGTPLFVLVKVSHLKNHTSWLPYIIASHETAELYECKINLTGKVKMSWRGACRNLQSEKTDRQSCFSVTAECLRGIVMEERQNNSYEITVRITARGTAGN